jgi:sugar-specific transcriptional regulator TrmB
MTSVVELLQKVGLTEYEAKTYLALLNTHIATALWVSEKSGVPRTKIYMVLEALRDKGWVKVYSGVPLLFKANHPSAVFDKVKDDYALFLDSVQSTLKTETGNVKEKFVIKKANVGIDGLKQEIAKAKTVEINNATTAFVKKVSDAFAKDAVVRILLYPGEAKLLIPKAQFKEAEVAMVSIIRNKEVPSMSIILDEERTFTALQDPIDHNYLIEEMLYDECQHCFAGWSNMGWNAGGQ